MAPFGVKLLFLVATHGLLFASLQSAHVYAEPQVPGYFIFGDSIFDNGNNNLLLTQAKANYIPYGVDFRDTPTGRFSNGRNSADFLAERLGFDSPSPPFATAIGPNVTRGVNYASGAAGILDETGTNLGDRLSFNRQLLNHQITISRITSLLLGKDISPEEYLSKCLYTVAIGSNDYLNNYLMPHFYPTSRQYTPQQFANVLSTQFSQQLTTLYNQGARKIAIFGVSNLGCIPEALSRYQANQSGCVEFINEDVRLFNDKLKMVIDDLNSKFADAKYIYINVINISNDIAPSLVSQGVRNFKDPCCKVSRTTAEGQCARGANICSNRNEYVFWDNFHPTEIVNRAIAKAAYSALKPLDVYL